MFGGSTQPDFYNIYDSPDGGTYALLAQVPGTQNVYLTGYTGSADRWYYLTAEVGGLESAPSATVRAEPATTVSTMSIVSPSDGQTGVSTAPTISWNAASGAANYYLAVKANDEATIIWAYWVPSSVTSVTYGETTEQVLVPPVENPLHAGTTYKIFIVAVNALNWGHNSGGFFSFTTSP
jgi:hypothetical protein